YTLTLDEGQHVVTLEHDGFEPLKLAVDATPNTHESLTPVTLRPIATPAPPRTVRLVSETPDVVFMRNGAALPDPFVTLKEGQVVQVTAHARDCRPVQKEIAFGVADEAFNFVFNDCDPVEATATTNKTPNGKPTSKVRVPKTEPPAPTLERGCVTMSIQNP